MTKRLLQLGVSADELLKVLIDLLERRGVLTWDEVLQAVEAVRATRAKETAAVFMEGDYAPREEPQPEAPPPPPPKPSKEHRISRRTALKLPIRIRAHAPNFEFTEITETANVSRSGVYFHTEKPYQAQRDVLVVVPYDPRYDAQAMETNGMVVRVDQKPGEKRRGVAIHMPKIFFKMS